MSLAVATVRVQVLALATVLVGAGVAMAGQVQAPDILVEIGPGGLMDQDGGVSDPATGHSFVSAHGWGAALRIDGAWYATCRADGLDCNPLRLERVHEEDHGDRLVERHAAETGPVLEVRQSFEPVEDDVVLVTVTLQNVGTLPAETVFYRSVWKFAVDPAPDDGPAQGRQLVDIRSSSPIAYTSTHGNARVSPLEDPSTPSGPSSTPRYPDTCGQIRLGPGTVSQGLHVDAHGPCNNGFLAEAALGALAPGEERTVRLVLALAPDATAAHALMRGHADAWAVAYPHPDDVPTGETARAFATGIRPLIEPPTSAFVAEASLPDPLPSTWSSGAVCIDHPVTFLDRSHSEVGLASATWDHGDGDRRTMAPWNGIHQHTFKTAGDHKVALEVRDKAGRTARAEDTVRAVDCGMVPVPVLTYNVLSNTCAGWSVRFDAGGSHDPDGSVASTRWTIGGVHHEGPTATVDPMEPLVSARLVVVDDSGKQSVLQRTVVRPPVQCHEAIDTDGDGHLDGADNCRLTWNPLQVDIDHDGAGDACDQPSVRDSQHAAAAPVTGTLPDSDDDGIADPADNCPTVPNPKQENLDRDSLGDACDKDLDGDGIVQSDEAAYLDNCPFVHNPLQEDTDGDGLGDACHAPVLATQQGPSINGPSATVRDALESPGLPNWALASLGAASVALVAAAPTAWRRWTPLLAVGFSRLSGTQVEEHPVRQRIVQLLGEKPGLHFHAIVREVGKGRGTVRHHLDVLTKAGMVRAHAAKGFTAFYPGGARVHNVEARTALQSPLAWRILQAACHTPGASVSELARLVGSRHGTVHHHVQRLRELGLLESQDAGRARALYPSPQGLEILSTADVARVGLE